MIAIFVPGVPRPQGSKRIVGGVTSRARMVESSGEPLKNWRAAVTWAAREAYRGPAIETGVALTCVFRFPRPKSHLRRDGSLRDAAPREHTQKPDLGKLIRAVEDSLTDAGIWRDDSLVCEYRGCEKKWTTDLREVGVTIAINIREEP